MTTEMIHVVLFNLDAEKFAEEFPGNALQEQIQGLMSKIPGLLAVDMNEKNATPWAGYVDAAPGYTHCLVSRHTDVAALKVYAEHPDHKAVQVRLGKCFRGPPLRVEMNVAAKL